MKALIFATSMCSTDTYKKPVFKNVENDVEKFQPLPQPRGEYPYHLQLQQVLTLPSSGKMVFHTVGDTGNVKYPNHQEKIVDEMIRQFHLEGPAEDNPAFFFHLGDLVYNHGEEHEYFRQFFAPYRDYPAPIFAIPGNHDSDIRTDVKDAAPSLYAFRKVFCDQQPQLLPIAGDTGRKTMTQPHVYWTLETPLATFINVYSNVPKFGVVTAEQKEWFIEELRAAGAKRNGKALIVCLHHSPYSADTNHGSSRPMQLFLNDAFEEAGVRPDIVFSGHVHNYQRFVKTYADGDNVTFVVAGGGGYTDLHRIARLGEPGFSADDPLLQDVALVNYCDQHHGFLKISIERREDGLQLVGEYFSIPEPAGSGGASLFDRFILNITQE